MEMGPTILSAVLPSFVGAPRARDTTTSLCGPTIVSNFMSITTAGRATVHGSGDDGSGSCQGSRLLLDSSTGDDLHMN